MGDNVLRSISVGSDLLNLDSIQESLKQIDEVVKDIPEYDPATNGGEEVVTIQKTNALIESIQDDN